MKKTLLTALAVAALSVGTQAQASPFWEGGVLGFDGINDYYVNDVVTLDWSSSGTGMAVGITPKTPLYVGQSFTFLYQASLIGYTDKNGQSITDANLNNKYEYTVVAMIPEVVYSVTNNFAGPGTQSASFTIQPGATWAIFRDTDPNSNVKSGFGFDDGVIAAKGTFTAGTNGGMFGATKPGVQGIGSSYLQGVVDATFSNFFSPPQGTLNGMIDGIANQGTLNQPPYESAVDLGGSIFSGRSNEGVYDAVLVDGSNQQFKVDGSTNFQTPPAVPEPSTLLLLGLGLFGIAGYSKRRMNK